MSIELISILAILLIFSLGVFWLKLPAGVSLMLSAVAVALINGYGVPLRHLVEGSFGFFDAILIVSTAMIFMKVVEATGALGTISYLMVKSLYKYPTILIILMTFFVMFPGMLTGLSSTCILTTGALVVPALLAMGMPRTAAGSLIAMAAVYGMIAPPINIPVMIIGGGVDMPYVGFDLPLLLVSFPPALFTALYFRFRYIKSFNIEEVLKNMPQSNHNEYGFRLYIPLIFVVGYIILIRVFPKIIPDVGIPLIFMIGSFLGYGSGKKFNIYDLSLKAAKDVLPIVAILVGVGILVQIMTLTGLRGAIAITALKVPLELIYLFLVLLMPAFGSAYASASILGVPLVYVFLGSNEIIVTAALSLLAGVGDLMPPPSLLCVFAAQLVGEKNHYRILKQSILPIIVTLLFGILIIIFADVFGVAISKVY